MIRPGAVVRPGRRARSSLVCNGYVRKDRQLPNRVARALPFGRAESDSHEHLGPDQGLARREEVAFLEAHVRLEQRPERGRMGKIAGIGGRKMAPEGLVLA